MFFGTRPESRRERKLRRENERLKAELAELALQFQEQRSHVRLLEFEQEKLLEIIERDRRRVQAETGGHAAKIAEHER